MPGSGLHGARILVVDDDEQMANTIERILRSEKFRSVTSITNPRTALGMASLDPPDLIILDLLMPEVDGYQFMEELRDQDLLGRIAILAVTGFSTDLTRQRVEDSGARAMLEKPFAPNELVSQVARLLIA